MFKSLAQCMAEARDSKGPRPFNIATQDRLALLAEWERSHDDGALTPCELDELVAQSKPEGVWQICPTCQGYGHTRDTARTKCPDCEGRAGEFVHAAKRRAA